MSDPNPIYIPNPDQEVFWKEFFDKYFDELVTAIARITGCESLAQDMILEKIGEMVRNGTPLWEKTTPKGYAYRSIYHHSLNELKSRKIENKEALELSYVFPTTEEQLAAAIDQTEEMRKWLLSLKKILSKGELQVLISAIIDKKKTEIIAQEMKTSVKTVQKHKSSAKAKLLKAKLPYPDWLILCMIILFIWPD